MNFLCKQSLDPMHRRTEWAAHVYTPIRVGKIGNRNPYIEKLAFRVMKCCSIAILAAPALTLWSSGGLIDKIGDNFTSKSYTYWSGTAEEKKDKPSKHTFFSLNYIRIDSASKNSLEISTEQVVCFDLENPSKALSDHHGLHSEITFNH